jgi:Outer membrane protein beta-barrel domain
VNVPIAAGILLICAASVLQAQTPRQSFGVGVSLDMTPTDGFVVGAGPGFEARTGNIHVAIRAGRSIRIEPMIGYARDRRKTSSSTNTSQETFSVLRASLGALYLIPRGSSFQVYTGGRLGMWRLRTEDRTTSPGFPTFSSSAKQTNLFLSAVFGGEYFIVPAFSVGGEAQLTYTSYGDIDFDVNPPPPPGGPSSEFSGSKVETAGLIVIRWFP